MNKQPIYKQSLYDINESYLPQYMIKMGIPRFQLMKVPRKLENNLPVWCRFSWLCCSTMTIGSQRRTIFLRWINMHEVRLHVHGIYNCNIHYWRPQTELNTWHYCLNTDNDPHKHAVSRCPSQAQEINLPETKFGRGIGVAIDKHENFYTLGWS